MLQVLISRRYDQDGTSWLFVWGTVLRKLLPMSSSAGDFPHHSIVVARLASSSRNGSSAFVNRCFSLDTAFGLSIACWVLAPETIVPKNTDHSMSYLTHFLTESGTIPSWVNGIDVFLDNAGSTNKI